METTVLTALFEWLGSATCVYAHPTTACQTLASTLASLASGGTRAAGAGQLAGHEWRVALVPQARANSQATPTAARSRSCLRRALVRVPEARVQELVVQFRHLRRQRLVSQARCGLEVVSVALLFRRDAGHGRQLSR